MVRTRTFRVETRGHTDILDITAHVAQAAAEAGGSGTATVFVSGSTAGITTVEHEPGVLRDLKEAFERIASERGAYHHARTAGDDNGSAHVRAALLGPSLTVPFVQGRLLLGTWQQIVLVDFDTRPRRRDFTVQTLSE